MDRRLLGIALIIGSLAAGVHAGPETAAAAGKAGAPPASVELNEHLAPLAPLIGRTLKGELSESTPEKPVVDVARWERAMNGQAVRVLHSINDGEYGGETIIMWDEQQQQLAYWYFTTAGFRTQGVMEIDGSTWTSVEDVAGNANGITKVRATSRLLHDGGLEIASEYLANGDWVPGHAVTYQPCADAQVVFR